MEQVAAPAEPQAPDPLLIAQIYLGTFAARTDAYADWYAAPDCAHGDDCACHWFTVREELTAARVYEALSSKRPISTYMEDAAGETHVAAIDFDREDGWELGLRIAAKITEAGGIPYLERSRRGAHLWVVCEEKIGGDSARLALRSFVADVSIYLARDPKVEILPKRLEQRGPETVGSPLRLPMMSHQRTGIRYPLCDAKGERIGRTISDAVLAIDLTPVTVMRAAAARAAVPISEVRVPDWARRPMQEGGDVVALLTGAGVQRANPGRTVRCPLHDDRNASLVVARDGERVWCKNPECPGYNNGRGLGADQLARALGGSA